MFALQRRGVHRHEHARRVARREDVVVGDVDLEGRHAGERARGRPDLGREVGQRRQVVAEQRAGAGEAVAGELHAVAGVAGEADDDAFELLVRVGRRRLVSVTSHPAYRPLEEVPDACVTEWGARGTRVVARSGHYVSDAS